MGTSVRGDFLGELYRTEEVNGNVSGSSQQEALRVEPPLVVGNEVSGGSVLNSASEDHNEKDNDSDAPLIEQETESSAQGPAAQVAQGIKQGSRFTATGGDIGSATYISDADAGDERSGLAVDQEVTDTNGNISGNNRQGTTLMKQSSLQEKHDHEMNGFLCHSEAENSMHSTSSHQAITVLENKGDLDMNTLMPSPVHGCKSEPNLQFDNAPVSEDSHNSLETVDLRTLTSAPAVMPMGTPLEELVREEVKALSPIASNELEKSCKSSTEVSPDIRGLQHAQTMPKRSFELLDGRARSSRESTFKRSSTDKSIADDDNPARTPGSKMSKKKQKELMKMCTVQKDGTVEFDVDRSARLAPDLFGLDTWEDYSYDREGDESRFIAPLQIAMLIVGTRGDVQPFVAIGKCLQEHGHRVRLATHSNFKEFVLNAGLEFYPLGGDPKLLAEYMVKNKGFLPSGPSELRTQRKQLKAIINSLLPACVNPDDTDVPFKANAIIANPPTLGHVHVAEALKVPLHIFFTMPWTPTSEFAHPLSRVHHFPANRLSYQIVDSVISWGIRGIINDFRKKKLKLRPITYLGGSQLSASKFPTGYIWSPHLVPKPKDWGPKIDVVGFCFLNLSQDYNPPDQLAKWLNAGPSPIYVGFGSLPVEDPEGMTEIIIKALAQTSQRAIINKGWGGLGSMRQLPDSVYLLDNCPHDWLFPQCAAVVHHGGAGTTAAGLKAACPTTVVPFFGDQLFWGDRVHAQGVGPPPIPVDQFCLDKLVHAINYMMDPEVKTRAVNLAEAIKEEDGVEGAVKAFHKHLPREMPEDDTPPMPSNSCFCHFKAPLPCF